MTNRLFVLDTNVLMHDPICLLRFDEHDIYLPMVVLEELDDHKIGLTETARNVRQVNRFLDELLKEKSSQEINLGLTYRERHQAWRQAAAGDALIIIGTRSTIFTPLAKPGMIIVDEEHDLSFKQQDGLRYSARDLAVVRASIEKIPVILGSATPALESLHNVDLQRYQLLSLPERAGVAVHPTFHIVDKRKQALKTSLSPALITMIRQHLQAEGQVLLFLNQRGYAPSLICHDCGWVAICAHCDAALTVHQKPLQLQCHHCSFVMPLTPHCKECLQKNLFPLGAGTERLAQTLQTLFNDYPIIRLDRDTTRRKGALQAKLTEIAQGAPAILVGTQILAKGHHFPNVTLAAMINMDSGLFSSDFRGAERMAQLALQVAGRAGRVEKPGEMVLQTYHPQHALINLLVKQDYLIIAQLLLREREQAMLPPYTSLVLLRADALQAGLAENFLQTVKENYLAPPLSGVEILGPIPAPMIKRAGKYRAQLLLQASSRKVLHQQVRQLVIALTHHRQLSRVRWSLDIDPQEMM